MRAPHRTAWLLACLLLAPAGARPESRLHAEAVLEPRLAAAGEPIAFTLRVERSGFSGVEMQPAFSLENLEIVAGPFESRQVQIRNTQVTRSHEVTWHLVPRHEGEASVRGIRVTVDGRTIELADQSLTVSAPPTGPGAPAPPGQTPQPRRSPHDAFEELLRRLPAPFRGAEPQTFLHAEIEPAEAWTGQQVVYTLHVYTQTRIRNSSFVHVPTFEGFWSRDVPLPDPRQARVVMIDGERYTHAILLQRALFPLAAGAHEIGPAEVEFTADMPGTGVWGGLRSEPQGLRRRSESATLEVRPLPPAPEGFAGAVGRFRLDASLVPEAIDVGEAATLELALSGEGNLQGLPEPRLAPPPGLVIHPAASRGEESFAGTRLEGRRSWIYPVVANQAGEHALAPEALVYFDPWRGEYSTAGVDPLRLAARRAPTPTDAGTETDPTPPSPAAAARRHRALWIAGALLLAAALALVATWSRRRDADDPTFAEALAAMDATRSARHTARRLEAAWRELLSRRHEISPAVPADRWPQHLAEAGRSERITGWLERVVADIRYLRHAPELASTDSLVTDLVEDSRRLARRLAR